MNGLLVFTVQGPLAALSGIWRSDGTQAGTFKLGSGTGFFPVNLAVSNGFVFFALGDQTTGSELWKTDGSVAGTQPVKDINPGPASSTPGNLRDVGGTLFFAADDYSVAGASSGRATAPRPARCW